MLAFRERLTGVALVALALACAQAPAPEPVPMPVTPPIAVVDTPRAPAFDRTKPPALGALGSLTIPPVVRRQLENGLEVLVVEHHELPVVDMVLVVKTGGEGDPAAKPGTATLTATMLDEGAGRRTALDIADQEAFLGVQVGTGSGWDQSTVTLHAPVAVLDSAMALFADVALRPTFPTADFERLRKERLTELLQLKDRAPQIADRAYAAILYGERHPYGRPLTGTEASTRAITRNDVRRFYQTYFRPNNATLIVVGDVTADDIERRVRALFGSWARADVPATTAERATGEPGDRDLSDRQAGRSAVVRAHRVDRRSALDGRLFRDPGDEHDSRRRVHQPAQHQPARDARLHVRGRFRLFHAPVGGAVHRARGGRGREERLVADRVHEGAARDSRDRA